MFFKHIFVLVKLWGTEETLDHTWLLRVRARIENGTVLKIGPVTVSVPEDKMQDVVDFF